jgi:SAM-dependent methyltransferase
LDLACGGGRHLRYLLAQGFDVVAVDIDVSGLSELADDSGVEILEADLEGGAWPFPRRRFDGIVVTNYLHRPLLPLLVDALSSNGVLIYETFAVGNEDYGHPRNPAFLLKPGELMEVFGARLRVVDYEQTLDELPRPAVRQRLCGILLPRETPERGARP